MSTDLDDSNQWEHSAYKDSTTLSQKIEYFIHSFYACMGEIIQPLEAQQVFFQTQAMRCEAKRQRGCESELRGSDTRKREDVRCLSECDVQMHPCCEFGKCVHLQILENVGIGQNFVYFDLYF